MHQPSTWMNCFEANGLAGMPCGAIIRIDSSDVFFFLKKNTVTSGSTFESLSRLIIQKEAWMAPDISIILHDLFWFLDVLSLKMSYPWFLVFFLSLVTETDWWKNNLIEPLKAAEVPRTADTVCVSATSQRFDSQWQLLKISLTLKWSNCQKQKYSSLAILLVTFFGMVRKWPFEMVKWPPIRGWKGHFESPGTLLLHVHCWILSPFFLTDLTEWPTAQSSYFPPKTSGNTDSLNHPPPPRFFT